WRTISPLSQRHAKGDGGSLQRCQLDINLMPNLERPCTPKAALTAIRQIPYVGYLMGRRSRGAEGRRGRGAEGRRGRGAEGRRGRKRISLPMRWMASVIPYVIERGEKMTAARIRTFKDLLV